MSDPAVRDVWRHVEAWVASHADAPVPVPGRGRTWPRMELLADVAGGDLSVGRLIEGHLDALAILDELGRSPTGPGVYGVWAARRPGELVASPDGDGWWLQGAKPFCSGAGLLSRALVVADAPDGVRLFDLDVDGVVVVEGTWPAVGMAGSASNRVCWPGQLVKPDEAVGPPGSYTDRIGFWWGAAGVAACWWGGARALLRVVRDDLARGDPGDAELAELGAGWATLDAAGAVLRQAAAQIDAQDGDDKEGARRTALVTRHAVHHACVDVLAAAGAAGGARPICLDPEQSRRSADLYAYLAQQHRGRDAAALGRMAVQQR
ncbi:MAG: acyl-CoA dehydrogenase [Actinomycetota bacterium]|nr:acyl-CoA dehydrogenase [Actinomycetota bacterium]